MDAKSITVYCPLFEGVSKTHKHVCILLESNRLFGIGPPLGRLESPAVCPATRLSDHIMTKRTD